MGPEQSKAAALTLRGLRLVRRLVRFPLGALIVFAAALIVRLSGSTQRPATRTPRLVFGPVPIINIKYMSAALRLAGYETLTIVDERYDIHTPDDFDADTSTYLRGWTGRTWSWLLGEYAVFASLLDRFDVFHYFFDGGFLRRTPLRWAEIGLLHIAGKKVVALPYGSDVAIPTQIRSLDWRHGLMLNYPSLGRSEGARRRAIQHMSARADYIVACLVHLETLPRWDLLTIHYYPIDTDMWSAPSNDSGHDGSTGPVSVLHAPNHRGLKGTEALIDTCRRLQAEGLQVDLRLLERVPNSRVRKEMERADIIADQFLLGYGITAMEGMSMGKPVMSNLEEAAYYDLFRRQTRFAECPIVSTSPETLYANLKDLVINPSRRQLLGEACRSYVVQEHSYSSMSRLWDAIYGQIWNGVATDPAKYISPRKKSEGAGPV